MNLQILAALGVIAQALIDIEAKVDKLMSEQAELNTDVANLVAAVAAVSAEIDALKAANPAIDFTGLETAIASVQALAPAPPAA